MATHEATLHGVAAPGVAPPAAAGGAARKERHLAARLLTAAVLLPPAVWVLWLGGWPMSLLIGAAAALATAEFYRLAFGRLRARDAVGLACAATLPLLPFGAPQVAAPLALLLVVTTSAAAWGGRVLAQDVEGAATDAPLQVAGLVFCALGPFFLAQLGAAWGSTWVVALLAATFANDAAAFFGGGLAGRHRLAPKVSPGKTWEGAAFGALGSALASACAAALLDAVTWRDALALTAVCSTLGPLGDLMKSAFKRARGVKDAGKLLPGHGGMLDRIDALLLNAPALWAWVQWGR